MKIEIKPDEMELPGCNSADDPKNKEIPDEMELPGCNSMDAVGKKEVQEHEKDI